VCIDYNGVPRTLRQPKVVLRQFGCDTGLNKMPKNVSAAEVTVIGGGIAGIAACIHLAKAGLQVLCIEPQQDLSQTVGESLDWSAPELLRVLGLPIEQLIREEVATYKRHVTLKLRDGSSRHYVPGDWLGRKPWNVGLKTMHVDRHRLGEALRNIALSHGVTLVQDKVVEVESAGRALAALKTAGGTRICSRWSIDASGAAANLFPRTFHLPVHEYGPKKVAIWAYFNVSELVEGTTLYGDCGNAGYMQWIWEIPIRNDRISVGYVVPGETIRLKRQQGLTVDDIFKEKLAQYSRFEPLLKAEGEITTTVRSFRCRVHCNVAGPNWVVVGEAASMVDPMTSNGVTAALRHAAEGSDLIIRSRHRRHLPILARAMYSRRIVDVGKFFNCGIEKVLYEGPIRERIGALVAGDVYTVPAWTLNLVYSRLRPKGCVSTLLYGCLLGIFRTAAKLYDSYCKRRDAARRLCEQS
jgi:flavin-dependent dehydrogenase